MIKNHESIDALIGVDVGKSNHHAIAINRASKKLLDRALPQDEAKLRAIIKSVAGKGAVLLVVDQPSTIGALPVAVAQAEGILVGYIPGLAMCRIAYLHPEKSKTTRDAAITAEAARSLPHTLRCIVIADEQAAELSMLCGYDDDLAKQATAASNRIRGLLTQIHPALERVIGPHLDHAAMAELLIKYPSQIPVPGEAPQGRPD
ncbi:transposase, IS111A/IS1328/IS1533 [Arthrobacter sp. PAMC 25486]|nr:transposase, IS111A/IS1328/IS1533 [Arthrobacter sp. PAMC 25486]